MVRWLRICVLVQGTQVWSWSGNIPHAMRQLSPWAETTEACTLEPTLCNEKPLRWEAHTPPCIGEQSPVTTTRESPGQQQRASTATNNSLVTKNHPNDQNSIPPYLEKSITVPCLILMLKSTHTYTLMRCGGEAWNTTKMAWDWTGQASTWISEYFKTDSLLCWVSGSKVLG